MPLTPNNREEHWLQGMVDGSTNLEPNKRREYWYKEIVDAIGSGGGGGGDVLIVHASGDPFFAGDPSTLDKTWNEIYNSTFAIIKNGNSEQGYSFLNVTGVYPGDALNPYGISAFFFDGENMVNFYFTADTADGYPVQDTGE